MAQETARGLDRRLRHYTRPHLLSIDEIGYLAYDAHAADLLFQIVTRRYEQKSIVLTTNLAFRDWHTIFPNAAVRRRPHRPPHAPRRHREDHRRELSPPRSRTRPEGPPRLRLTSGLGGPPGGSPSSVQIPALRGERQQTRPYRNCADDHRTTQLHHVSGRHRSSGAPIRQIDLRTEIAPQRDEPRRRGGVSPRRAPEGQVQPPGWLPLARVDRVIDITARERRPVQAAAAPRVLRWSLRPVEAL